MYLFHHIGYRKQYEEQNTVIFDHLYPYFYQSFSETKGDENNTEPHVHSYPSLHPSLPLENLNCFQQ